MGDLPPFITHYYFLQKFSCRVPARVTGGVLGGFIFVFPKLLSHSVFPFWYILLIVGGPLNCELASLPLWWV